MDMAVYDGNTLYLYRWGIGKARQDKTRRDEMCHVHTTWYQYIRTATRGKVRSGVCIFLCSFSFYFLL